MANDTKRSRWLPEGGGGLDMFDCPTKKGRRAKYPSCLCKPKCAICGFGPHMAIHSHGLGQPVGSEPVGHEYEAGT